MDISDISMESEPRTKYPEVKRWMEEYAQSKCTHIHARGLNEYYISDTPEQFLARALTQLDEHGVEQPMVRLELPATPNRPANNAHIAIVTMFAEDKKDYNSVALAMVDFRRDLLVICGPTIRDELSADAGGLAAKTFPQVIQHLYDRYGTPTSEDLKKERAKLGNKFSTPAQFVSEAARFKRTVAFLNANGDITSQPQQIQLLEGIPQCLARYKRRFPLVADRNVEALILAIQTELPLTTTQDAGYANAAYEITTTDMEAQANAVTTSATNSLTVLMEKLSNRLDNLEVGSRKNNGGRGPGGRNPRNSNPAGRGATRVTPATTSLNASTGPNNGPPTLYCFEHGTCYHAGKDCRTMANDATFTQAMKNVTKQCIIGGYQGSK